MRAAYCTGSQAARRARAEVRPIKVAAGRATRAMPSVVNQPWVKRSRYFQTPVQDQ